MYTHTHTHMHIHTRTHTHTNRHTYICTCTSNIYLHTVATHTANIAIQYTCNISCYWYHARILHCDEWISLFVDAGWVCNVAIDKTITISTHWYLPWNKLASIWYNQILTLVSNKHMWCVSTQATWSDKLVGSLLMLISITLFLYYSVWVLLLVSVAMWLPIIPVLYWLHLFNLWKLHKITWLSVILL